MKKEYLESLPKEFLNDLCTLILEENRIMEKYNIEEKELSYITRNIRESVKIKSKDSNKVISLKTRQVSNKPGNTDTIGEKCKKEVFSNNLKHYIKKFNITKRQLSNLSGLTTTHLTRLERGECFPQKETIIFLAKAMGIDPINLVSLSCTDSFKPEINKKILRSF